MFSCSMATGVVTNQDACDIPLAWYFTGTDDNQKRCSWTDDKLEAC